MKMNVKFYVLENGKEPVFEFLEGLSNKDKAKTAACLKSIEELGFASPRVNFRQIRGKLWEIKIRVEGGGLRIFYVTITNSILVLLHAYIKKSQKAPKKEMTTAEKRMKGVFENEESYYTR